LNLLIVGVSLFPLLVALAGWAPGPGQGACLSEKKKKIIKMMPLKGMSIETVLARIGFIRQSPHIPQPVSAI
jgi:hypothetical protein